jgi:hypothetical protein
LPNVAQTSGPFRSAIIGLIKFITSNESSLVKKMNLFSVALQVNADDKETVPETVDMYLSAVI